MNTTYCPICEIIIEAINTDEVNSGSHESYIFIHDDIPHEDSDIEALDYGLQ
jgi:hypothetical protein